MGSEKQTVSKNGGRHLKLNIGLIVFIGIYLFDSNRSVLPYEKSYFFL